MLVFRERGKPEYLPGEKPLGARERTVNKLNSHLASLQDSKPGQINGRRVLSSLRHPAVWGPCMLTSELTMNMLIYNVKRTRLLASHPPLSFIHSFIHSFTGNKQNWDRALRRREDVTSYKLNKLYTRFFKISLGAILNFQ